MAKKPYINAYVCKTGAHGDAKYNRCKAKRNWQKQMRDEGAFRGPSLLAGALPPSWRYCEGPPHVVLSGGGCAASALGYGASASRLRSGWQRGRLYTWLARCLGNGGVVAGQMGYDCGMDERVFHTGSGAVHYWVDAPDPSLPWIVFIPGLTADHSLFGPQLEFFHGKANLITWDAPAHAASRPYPLDFTLDDCAHILHGILEAEGAANPVYVGQSLGGYIGQCYLHWYPGAFAGFVSVDSAPLQRDYYQAWELAALDRMFRVYVSIPWKILVEWAVRGAATSPAGQANMREMMGRYKRLEYCRLAAHGFRILAQAVRADRPYVIDCPLLLLCGERDMAGSTKRYNKAWHERGGAHLEWVPEAGHNSTLDAPDFVNACIEEFVRACS